MIYLLIVRRRTDGGQWRTLRWDSPVLCLDEAERDIAIQRWTRADLRVEVRTFNRYQVRDLLAAQ